MKNNQAVYQKWLRYFGLRIRKKVHESIKGIYLAMVLSCEKLNPYAGDWRIQTVLSA